VFTSLVLQATKAVGGVLQPVAAERNRAGMLQASLYTSVSNAVVARIAEGRKPVSMSCMLWCLASNTFAAKRHDVADVPRCRCESAYPLQVRRPTGFRLRPLCLANLSYNITVSATSRVMAVQTSTVLSVSPVDSQASFGVSTAQAA